jgi:hypothetical protein
VATPWRDYEELAQFIVESIEAASMVTTTKIGQDIEIRGRSTTNRIDVLWEFTDQGGFPQRVAIEARAYARRINQQALHGWRAVVDDISHDGVNTMGVMVTETGYQSGAIAVADTYGIVIAELRKPTEADLAGRLRSIELTVVARVPLVRLGGIDVVEPLHDFQGEVPLEEMLIERSDGSSERLIDILLAGELSAFEDPPASMHPVERTFDPPVTLIIEGVPVARIKRATGSVGEHDLAPTSFQVGGPDRLAWLLKNTLSGAHTWFAVDGRHHTTD